MEYPGLEAADLSQVHALNRAFLDYALSGPRRLAGELPATLREPLLVGGRELRSRLSRCAFLLFSVSENDEQTWEPLFANQPQRDLLDRGARTDTEELQLTCAALGLVWQLARRNPYSARVISGASLGWCEQLADVPLMDLIRYAAMRGNLLRVRAASDGPFWAQLGRAATSEVQNVRAAARATALQCLLTGGDYNRQERLRTAACSMPLPPTRVASRRDVSQRGTRGYNTPLHESPLDKKPKQDLRKR